MQEKDQDIDSLSQVRDSIETFRREVIGVEERLVNEHNQLQEMRKKLVKRIVKASKALDSK